jgi:transposase
MEAVGSTALILIEAPSSAYRRGMLVPGKRQHTKEEETSCDSTPSRTSFMVASTCTPAPWSLCILNQDGEIVFHHKMKTAPEPFLKAVAPYREDLVVCVECIFTWYWLADLCAREGIPFVLGHALSRKAIHGGKAKNDRIDAHKIAILLRGGMLPQAYVYPAEMRATRDLLRRRMHLTRKRAELLAHIQHTNSQDHLPEIGKKLAYKANRDGVAERFPEPAVQKNIEVDLTLIGHDDRLLTALELDLVQTAKAHDAQTFYRWRSIPGVGKILALVLRYEIHDIRRFPRVQAFVSYCRLVKCAKESAGKRYGSSGQKLGHAYLKWACSEAAVLFLRHNPAGQKYLTRVARKHGKGKALTILAHKLARAVYDMLKRDTAFDVDKFLRESWSGAGEPAASLAAEGISLAIECWQP